MQLNLFEDNSEMGLIKQEINEIRKASHNVRRGIFSRHHELEKMILDLKEDIGNLRMLIVENKS